jgi:hypothetical protein
MLLLIGPCLLTSIIAVMAYYNEENLDEHDSSCESDDDTIQMDSPEFWNAVDNLDLPAIPDSVRLS